MWPTSQARQSSLRALGIPGSSSGNFKAGLTILVLAEHARCVPDADGGKPPTAKQCCMRKGPEQLPHLQTMRAGRLPRASRCRPAAGDARGPELGSWPSCSNVPYAFANCTTIVCHSMPIESTMCQQRIPGNAQLLTLNPLIV